MLRHSIVDGCTVFVVDKSLGILKDPRGFDLLVRPRGPIPIVTEHGLWMSICASRLNGEYM